MDKTVTDSTGRKVGLLKELLPHGWQVYVCYGSRQLPLVDPEIGPQGFYASQSLAKKALACHIEGLCLLHKKLTQM